MAYERLTKNGYNMFEMSSMIANRKTLRTSGENMKHIDRIYFQYLMLEYNRIRAKYCKPLEKSSASATMKEDGGSGSGNHNHRGRPGQVGGSTPTPSARGANMECTGFADSKLERYHIKKHLREYNGMTGDEYVEHAKQFLAQPCSDTVDGYITRKGEVVRFDRTTGEYAKGVPGGKILICYIVGYDEKADKSNLNIANKYFDKLKKNEGANSNGQEKYR